MNFNKNWINEPDEEDFHHYLNKKNLKLEHLALAQSEDIKNKSNNTENKILKKLNDVSQRQIFGNNSQPTNELLKSFSQFEHMNSKKIIQNSNLNSSSVTDSKFNFGNKTNILKSSMSSMIKRSDTLSSKIIFKQNMNSKSQKLSLLDNNKNNSFNEFNYSKFENKKNYYINYSKNSLNHKNENIKKFIKKDIWTNPQKILNENLNLSQENNYSESTFYNSNKEIKNYYIHKKHKANLFSKFLNNSKKDERDTLHQSLNSKIIQNFESIEPSLLQKKDDEIFNNSENIEETNFSKFKKVSTKSFKEDKSYYKLKSLNSKRRNPENKLSNQLKNENI